jgi:hypothetical protein
MWLRLTLGTIRCSAKTLSLPFRKYTALISWTASRWRRQEQNTICKLLKFNKICRKIGSFMDLTMKKTDNSKCLASTTSNWSFRWVASVQTDLARLKKRYNCANSEKSIKGHLLRRYRQKLSLVCAKRHKNQGHSWTVSQNLWAVQYHQQLTHPNWNTPKDQLRVKAVIEPQEDSRPKTHLFSAVSGEVGWAQ